ncbi:MAG: cation diffusion facilitator family transporter [Oscillospiraceae bacterium]|nr:cation diffusion facilitator family transporter [Oscillospiraceae bacterium]
MSELLVKLFIKDHKNTKSESVRQKYGFLSGIVGIIVNICLTAAKFIIGFISHSIAITGDALNNLSDAGSCIVTLAGFKMANMKPDKEHPFGHGRLEYIAALIVGFFVEMMGFELIKSSIDKIRNPEPVVFSIPAVIVLLLSIGGKLWLALFNRHLGKKINSPALTAVVADSIGDITATSFTLLALVLSKFTTLPLDGFFGIAVALFIMYSGYGILKETIGVILGTPPSKELVDNLVMFIMSHPGVMGIHDLMIHSYGESRMFASVHIEILSSEDILKAHDVIDLIEKEVLDRFGIQLVAHLDPLIVDDQRINTLRDMTANVVEEMDESFKIHDFRVVEGPTHTNLIFDMVVPFDCKKSEKELKETLEQKIKEKDENYFVVATIEGSYI